MFGSRALLAGTFVVAATGMSHAASVYKHVDVKASADKVWALIGPFCSIKDWHPAIGRCTETNGVRTLTTKDGRSHFVEKQTDRKQLSYSYAIEKSPLPITGYRSTIKVLPRGDGTTTVEWSSTFTPDAGKEQAATDAIGGIYDAGLANIKTIEERT